MNASITSNVTAATTYDSIRYFEILKYLKIEIYLLKLNIIKEVFWCSPQINWVNCNMDETAKGCHKLATRGGIFRDNSVASLGCFAVNFGIQNSIVANLWT